jgi:magnesium and cobalt transporter
MSEDHSTTGARKSWLEKLADAFSQDLKNRSQVEAVLHEAHNNELLDSAAYHIMQGALAVSDQHARDIMIPRLQMVVIEPEDSLATILDKIIASAHSRFPVMNEDNTAVVGILLAKDLLRLLRDEQFNPERMSQRLHEIVRTPVFVPESKRLNRLLREFRETRNHMAVVVDEYGSVAGLVTIEDVLEEIVGDIEDEHDPLTEQPIQDLGHQHFRVAALTEIAVFNEFFTTEYSDEEFDTIGGYVTHVFGHLPQRGEAVTIGMWHFVVAHADDRRILTLEVRPANAEQRAEDVTAKLG